MYLTKLYKQSKPWFVIVCLFAAGQLFINYKNGIELSPFYHYSMFSLPFHFTNSYQTTEVWVNGMRLKPEDFTPNGWDNVVMPIVQYQKQKQWNALLYETTIKRLLHTSDSALYLNHVSQRAFDQWYQQRIIRLLHVKDSGAAVAYRIVSYHFTNDSLYRQ